MAIHEVDGHFVISAHRVWMPGVYESERAAKYAFRFCEDRLVALRNGANASNDGVITLEAMKLMRRTRGFSCGQGAHRAGWTQGDPIVFDKEQSR